MLSISKPVFLGNPSSASGILGVPESLPSADALLALLQRGQGVGPAGDTFQLGGLTRTNAAQGSACRQSAAPDDQELRMLVQLLAMLIDQAGQGGGSCQSALPLARANGPAINGLNAPNGLNGLNALNAPSIGANPAMGAALRAPGRDLGALTDPWGNITPNNALGGATQLPPNALAAQALQWSQAQMNPLTATAANPNNGLSVSQNGDAWTNWCLAFVSAAYGYGVPELRAMTAFDSFKQFAAEGKIVQDRNPPAGAPVYFNQTARTPWGHVGIATGKTTATGDPIIRTTGKPGYPGIYELPLSVVEKETAGYLGWAAI